MEPDRHYRSHHRQSDRDPQQRRRGPHHRHQQELDDSAAHHVAESNDSDVHDGLRATLLQGSRAV